MYMNRLKPIKEASIRPKEHSAQYLTRTKVVEMKHQESFALRKPED